MTQVLVEVTCQIASLQLSEGSRVGSRRLDGEEVLPQVVAFFIADVPKPVRRQLRMPPVRKPRSQR